MTLIIGMFYSDGAIIISDSRTMIGADYSRERKVIEVSDGSVIFAASGYTGIAGKLVPAVEQTRIRSRRLLKPEIVEVFEDEMAEIWRRYKGGSNPRFARDDHILTGIIGFLDDDKPKLYCLHENGYAEPIANFRAIGDGSRHAQNILKTLHNNSISKEEALDIGIHTIMQVATIDAVVDNCPQIAVLEKGIAKDDVKILNCDADGNFYLECSEIEVIKKKINGIEDKRTQVFRLLLNGQSSLVRKLNKVLKEYEQEKQEQPPQTEEPTTKD